MGVMFDKYGFNIYDHKDLDILNDMFFNELDQMLSLSESYDDFIKEDFSKVMYMFYMLGIDLLEEGCLCFDEYDGSDILDMFRKTYDYEKDNKAYVYIKFLMIYEFYTTLFEYKNYHITEDYTALNEIFDDTADLPPSPLRDVINDAWLHMSTETLRFWDDYMDLIDDSFTHLYYALAYFYERYLTDYSNDNVFIDMINFILDINPLDVMLCRYIQAANFSDTDGFELDYGDPLPELDEDHSSYFYEKSYSIFKF